jgi:hypothetical protein
MKVKGNLTPGGDGNSFAPGDFGLVDPPNVNSSGAKTIRNLLSSQSPKFCFVNGVSPRTGEAVQKVSDGINVRFDMPVNGDTTGLDTAPALNVIKGLFHDKCNGNPKYDPAGTVPLPLDGGTRQVIGNMELGGGSLDLTAANAYWTNHYGSNWPADLQAVGQANRYLAYRRELGLDGQTAPNPLPSTENRAPVCQAPTAESTAERRIVSVAIIDCSASGVRGNSNPPITSVSYANFFLFRPSWDYVKNNASSGDVWGEFLEVITVDNAGSGGKLHQIVQLYRDQ